MAATTQYALDRRAETGALISNVLIPVDFSERGTDAARFAVQLARSFQARATLFHVEKPPEGDLFWMAEIARWEEDRMSGFLPESVKDPKVRRIIRVDPDVSGTILRYAQADGVDLIVMPTHGYGALRRSLWGSVTPKVLRGARCPVWTTALTAPASPGEWLNPESILCVAASASEGERILAWASRFADRHNAQLCIAWSRKGLQKEREAIDWVERNYRIFAETVVDPGDDVPEVLREAALRHRAGMMVIGRDSWRRQGTWGPNGYEIIRQASCPVVSV